MAQVADSKFRLLAVSAEIRMKIYRNILADKVLIVAVEHDGDSFHFYHRKEDPKPNHKPAPNSPLAILRTCRQIYQEALPHVSGPVLLKTAATNAENFGARIPANFLKYVEDVQVLWTDDIDFRKSPAAEAFRSLKNLEFTMFEAECYEEPAEVHIAGLELRYCASKNQSLVTKVMQQVSQVDWIMAWKKERKKSFKIKVEVHHGLFLLEDEVCTRDGEKTLSFNFHTLRIADYLTLDIHC